MNDYIKREDALNEMAKAECGLGYEECTDCSCSYIGRIRDIPAADVVEVGIKYYESSGYRIIVGEDTSERVKGGNGNFVRLPASRWFKIERF